MTRSVRRVAISAALALAFTAASGSAAGGSVDERRGERDAGGPVHGAPRILPGDAEATTVPADRRTWIVGARPGRVAAAVARRHDAAPLGGGAYVVSRAHARALAYALLRRDLLVYAEPDRLAHGSLAPAPDPLSAQAGWRDAVVDPALEPPELTAQSPLLGMVDTAVDLSHPEFRGANVSMLGARSVTDAQGTATASVAAAPANGVGILGIWPGMRAVNSPLPGATGGTCSEVTRSVRQAIEAGAAVIYMGYGFGTVPGEPGSGCFSQYAALQAGVRDGVVPVASAGIRLASGEGWTSRPRCPTSSRSPP